MSSDFPERKSIRLQNFDYSSNGYYFVTVLTKRREELLGKIEDKKMVVNEMGKIIDFWLQQIHKHFKQVIVNEYQIMPNHVHLILAVRAGLSRPKNIIHKTQTLGQIIAYFKYESTKQINNSGLILSGAKTAPLHKIFHRNYFEHIIRNEKEYFKIQNYIKTNPENWETDINDLVNNIERY